MVPHVFFAYSSGFSAMLFHDEFFSTMYNTLFTCSALFNKGAQEWDINTDIKGRGEDKIEPLLPSLYWVGQEKTIFNRTNYVKECLLGVFHGFIVYYIPYATYCYQYDMQSGTFTPNHQDFWSFSCLSYTAMLFLVTNKLMFETRYYNMNLWIAFFPATYFLYLACMWYANSATLTTYRFAVLELHNQPDFYLNLTLILGFCAMLDYLRIAISYNGVCFMKQFPNDYLRHLVANGLDIDDHKEEFDKVLKDYRSKDKPASMTMQQEK
jgi:magnesium-transporting ATPase (P-type)